MDLIGLIVREIATIVAYGLVFAGVYKLFQIATDLGQIKELLKERSISAPVSPAMIPAARASADSFSSGDDASEYAQRLLRAVNAENASVPAAPSTLPETRSFK